MIACLKQPLLFLIYSFAAYFLIEQSNSSKLGFTFLMISNCSDNKKITLNKNDYLLSRILYAIKYYK